MKESFSNILYAIFEGKNPIIVPLAFKDVKNLHYSNDYEPTYIDPQGTEWSFYVSYQTIEDKELFFIAKFRKLFNENDVKECLVSFDKKTLVNTYVGGLRKHIVETQEVIESGHRSIQEMTNKIEYIKKQYNDSLENG